MDIVNKIYKLKGRVLHYAWGGQEFLPGFLGMPNPDNKPFAEYWLGAHPLAPSELETAQGPVLLNAAIQE
ncbi:MAG: manA, partial [Sediminibacterium sp.]|nr:manA [Sediminibacterium sp.]